MNSDFLVFTLLEKFTKGFIVLLNPQCLGQHIGHTNEFEFAALA